MWKFHEFSITRILREINLGDSKKAKSSILSHLEALNLEFNALLHLLKLKFTKLSNFRVTKMAKMAVLELLDYATLISRKIRMTEKS